MCSRVTTPVEDPVRPLDVLEREICELAADIAAATCRWLLLLAEWDERRGWAEWGTASCAHWLSWRCSIGPGTAREHVRVARSLTGLPLVREAFGRGELSYSKVRAITRVAAPETEAQLVALARDATGAQLEKLVRGYRGVLAATAAGAEHAHETRYLRWDWEEDGSLTLRARLSAEDGALMVAALAAGEAGVSGSDEVPEHTPEGLAERDTVEQRRADALVHVARAALSAEPATGNGHRPNEMVVHVDVETLAAADRGPEGGGRGEISGGPALAPETLRRLGCDAAIVRIVERDGRPLSVGRRTRTISPALRRALRGRDGTCRFPGCEHDRFLHAHHIRHWAHGGSTELGNLVHLCSRHHRLVHEGGFTVERAGTGLRFRRPDGRVLPAACAGERPRSSGLAAQNRQRGIAVDAGTCRARCAGDPLDYGIAVEGLLGRAAPRPTGQLTPVPPRPQ